MGRPILRTYPNTGPFTSLFSANENPLREGGIWTQYADGFTEVKAVGGRAQATNGITDTYDDSACYLNTWTGGNNYRVGVHLYVDAAINTSFNHEVAIQLRKTGQTSIEVLLNALGGIDILSWSGPGGTADFFTEILAYSGSPPSPATGDLFEASIVGNLISVYYNTVLLYTADTGGTNTTGKPGMSFFLRPGANSAHFCFEDWTVRAL